jgi:hypothetical protein
VSIYETLGVEVWKALQPGVTTVVSSGLTSLAELITRRVRVLPRDPVRAGELIGRLMAEDADLARVVAEHLAALDDSQAYDGPAPEPLGFADRDKVRALLAVPGTHLVVGFTGVGKTYLTQQVLHDGAECFPDGQHYLDLDPYRTTGGVLLYADVQRDLMSLLRFRKIETSERLLSAQYGRALLRRRFAVVFDNVLDAEEIRHLGRGWPAAAVMFTARSPDVRRGTPSLQVIELQGLDEPGVRWLLDDAGVSAALDAEPEAAGELLDLCDGYPLTVRLAAELLHSRGAEPGAVRKTVAELRSNPDPDGTDATMIGLTLRRLLDPIPADLALLARHPGSRFTFDSATVLLGRPAEATLRGLQAACLLVREPSGWWRLPGPVRAFAARVGLPEPVVDEAIDRMLDRYPVLAVAADLATEPDRLRRFRIPDDLVWDVETHPVSWLGSNLPMLAGLASLAEARGRHIEVLQLCGASEVVLTYEGHHQIVAGMLEVGVRSAVALEDMPALCRLHITRSRIARELGHPAQAAAYLTEAIAAFAGLDAPDPRLEASLLEARSAQSDDSLEAIRFMTEALEIDRAAGLGRPRGLHARMLAKLLVAAGQAGEALTLLDEATEYTDQRRNLSRVHTVRAWVFLGLRMPAEAAQEVEYARRFATETGAGPRYEFEHIDLAAEIAVQSGDVERARTGWGEIVDQCARNGSPDFDRYFAKLSRLPPR